MIEKRPKVSPKSVIVTDNEDRTHVSLRPRTIRPQKFTERNSFRVLKCQTFHKLRLIDSIHKVLNVFSRTFALVSLFYDMAWVKSNSAEYVSKLWTPGVVEKIACVTDYEGGG